jgi:uncharacterized phage protein (TIGR01671 family)
MKATKEILFRAKRLKNREWIEGFYFYREWECGNKVDKHFIVGETNAFHSYQYEINPTTLSQFTGWKDRHENRIYENDIVEIATYTGLSEKYLIWWNREMSMTEAILINGISSNGTDYYNHKSCDYETFCVMMQDPWGDFGDIKVIGNLFDNPELIEEALDETN